MTTLPNVYFVFERDDGNHVYLGNYEASLPESTLMMDPQYNIKSVLSILEFPHKNEALKPLEEIFETSIQRVSKTPKGVMYYNINIPDVNNPSLLLLDDKVLMKATWNDYELKHDHAIEVLFRASQFIAERLKYGSVYVHCEKGQKRSPTMILAYLIQCGHTTSEALNLISKDYKDIHHPSYDWGVKYRASRERWIELLQTWSSREKELRALWKKLNRDLICRWNELDPDNLDIEDEEAPVQRKRDRVQEEKPKNKKRLKRVMKPTLPTTWRNKKIPR